MKQDGIDLSKNIAITSFSEMKQICMPLLKHFDITYFNYVKLFKNGARTVLTNGPEFTKAYYLDKKLYQTQSVLSMEQLEKPSIHFFYEFQDQWSYVISRNEFDIDNGITIIQPLISEQATELFYFATRKNNYHNIHLYHSNLDVFYRFILYFKEQARKLIKQAEKEKFFIHTPKAKMILPSNELQTKLDFYTDTSLDKLHLDLGDGELTLSRREIDCLYLTLQNKTAKEVGKILTISPRTAESYLSNLKLKVNCQTKTKLIQKFADPLYQSLLRNAVNLADLG